MRLSHKKYIEICAGNLQENYIIIRALKLPDNSLESAPSRIGKALDINAGTC